MTPLTDQQRQDIEKELFADHKISAIKLYRDATGAGLVDAKKAVEDMEAALRQQSPERFTAAEKRGCLGMVMCLVLLAGGVTAALIHILH